MSHLDEVAMGSEERQELEANIDELEDKVSVIHCYNGDAIMFQPFPSLLPVSISFQC